MKISIYQNNNEYIQISIDDNSISAIDTPYQITLEKRGKSNKLLFDFQQSEESITSFNDKDYVYKTGVNTGRIYEVEYDNRQLTGLIEEIKSLRDKLHKEERRKYLNAEFVIIILSKILEMRS